MPLLEGLEDRKLLYSTLGASFQYGSRITYSFAPDGTNIGGTPSAMFQSMSKLGFTTSQWEAAFQKAAASWEAVTNVNFVQVSDDGSSFGIAGDQQGDPRFGDIRIGATPLASGALATCFLPPKINGGSLAGDMVFNTKIAWQINNDYDLQTVAMHEFGHVLGLDHSSVTTAAMYKSYNGQKQTLSSDDIAGAQAVYGVRQPDQYDAGAGNNSATNATNITAQLTSLGQAAIPSLDITTSTDSDWFVVTAPANASGSFTVTMQSSDLSSLSPKVLLYNSAMQGMAAPAAANTFGSTATASISNVTPGQKFYIKCMAANGGITGIGGYGLLVNFGSGAMNPIAPPNTTVAQQPDQGGGNSNDGAGGGDLLLNLGSLLGVGDELTVDSTFQQAFDIVNAGVAAVGTFISPLETYVIDVLAAAGHAAPNTTAGNAAKAAAIQAIMAVLEDWGT